MDDFFHFFYFCLYILGISTIAALNVSVGSLHFHFPLSNSIIREFVAFFLCDPVPVRQSSPEFPALLSKHLNVNSLRCHK